MRAGGPNFENGAPLSFGPSDYTTSYSYVLVVLGVKSELDLRLCKYCGNTKCQLLFYG